MSADLLGSSRVADAESPSCGDFDAVAGADPVGRRGGDEVLVRPGVPPEWAGGSVIAAVEFPGFPVTLAKAGVVQEVITATIDFAAIGK